jgi:glycosyltransferase involved in cell wall biosynthesis
MKINILDSGLRAKPGHHYDFDRKLTRWLSDAGHDVHVYGNVEMDAEIVKTMGDIAPLTRLFRVFQYHPPERVDFYAGELMLFESQRTLLMQDLQAVREADLWIWPSIRPQHLAACASSGTTASVVGCVHEDPGIAERTVDAMLWRIALLRAHHSPLRYTIGAIEAELRQRFMLILPDGRFPVFPHPYDGPPLDKPKTALKRIGVFGQQRAEKGVKLMGRLFRLLLADGYEIVFHDSANIPKRIEHPNLRMLDFVDDISGALRKCDLVVMPYDIDSYRIRGSGILTDCLSLGVPVVGPYGTIPGRTIEHFQAGPLFVRTSSDAIYSAVKLAHENYSTYAEAAFKAARAFGKNNGVGRYAEAILAAA